MRAAPADITQNRRAMLSGLKARNRLVAILRIGVPTLGAIVLVALVAQIYLGGLLRDFNLARVSFDRNALAVETPSYAGTSANGTPYLLSAEHARVRFDVPGLIDLTNASLSYGLAGDDQFAATAVSATIDTGTQALTVPGITNVSTGSGMHGTLIDVSGNFPAQQLAASGDVALDFADGTQILARSMTHDGKLGLWVFHTANVTLSATPGEAP